MHFFFVVVEINAAQESKIYKTENFQLNHCQKNTFYKA